MSLCPTQSRGGGGGGVPCQACRGWGSQPPEQASTSPKRPSLILGLWKSDKAAAPPPAKESPQPPPQTPQKEREGEPSPGPLLRTPEFYSQLDFKGPASPPRQQTRERTKRPGPPPTPWPRVQGHGRWGGAACFYSPSSSGTPRPPPQAGHLISSLTVSCPSLLSSRSRPPCLICAFPPS